MAMSPLPRATRVLVLLSAAAGLAALPAPARASAPNLMGPPIVVPCWVSNPRLGPSGHREILAGNLNVRLWGGTGLPPLVHVNAFYDDPVPPNCGWSDWSNQGIPFPAATDFVVRLDSAMAIDDHPSSGGTVVYEITLEGRSGSCDGAVTNADTVTRSLSFAAAPAHDWIDANVYDHASPARLAFKVRSAPFAGSERYFRYKLRVTASNDSGPAVATEEGCFKLTTF
jgi:hypothetical protein